MRRFVLILGLVLLVVSGSARAPGPPAYASGPPSLARWPDEAPGPPFELSVSANRPGPQRTYLVSGLVRNDGDQTYEAIGVLVTFYSANGFRYGPIEARCPCTLLAPGESCPFIVQPAMRNPIAFVLHPAGRPTKRESAPVTLSEVQLIEDGLYSVRITGRVTNQKPFKIKNPIVTGVLVDGAGQIVRLGYTYLLIEEIAPGSSARFDLRVSDAPHISYRLYAQAERDW